MFIIENMGCSVSVLQFHFLFFCLFSEQLHHQDNKIKECCDEKNRLIQELMGANSNGEQTDGRPVGFICVLPWLFLHAQTYPHARTQTHICYIHIHMHTHRHYIHFVWYISLRNYYRFIFMLL